MKKTLTFLVILAISAIPAFAGGGNGAPSGGHYTLNIIGVPKAKTADMTNTNGHSLFVKLEGKTKIMLQPGDFSVVDRNGTDGEAIFQLPNPDPDNDGFTEYSVYARALGIPGGSAILTTCAYDIVDGEEVLVCSELSTVFVREKGKPSFTNVSKNLLYIFADLDGDSMAERYPLFDDDLYGYFWDYDNNGLKVVQLRFYEIVTDVNDY